MKISEYIKTLHIQWNTQYESCVFISRPYSSYENVFYYNVESKLIFKRNRGDFKMNGHHSIYYKNLPLSK